MKIIWNKNPLRTVIELDDHDKEMLKLKIKVNQLEEDMGSASVLLDPKNASWVMKPSAKHPEGRTLESLVSEVLNDYLDLSYMYSEGKYDGKGLDARVDEILAYYLDDLKGPHFGDCVCFACSCTKCHAEELLGVDTIRGLGKYAAHKIEGAFGKNSERTIDEALEHLKNYEVTPPTENLDGWAKVGGWEKYVPRWTAEAKAAHEWLLKYREDHPEVAGSTESAET